MVFKLARPYLRDLCPDFVSERSCFSLRSAKNLCVSYVRTDRPKEFSFFFFINKIVEQSAIRDAHTIFSRHFQAQPFEMLAFFI